MLYESASFSVPGAGSERQGVLERERQRAFGFALWHAAEIAKANGFEAVSVEQDRRDVDVSVRTEPSYLWPGFYRPYYPYHYRYRPWLLYDDDCCWPGHVHYQRWASARVTVALAVELLEAPAEGEEVFDVDDTLARLGATVTVVGAFTHAAAFDGAEQCSRFGPAHCTAVTGSTWAGSRARDPPPGENLTVAPPSWPLTAGGLSRPYTTPAPWGAGIADTV